MVLVAKTLCCGEVGLNRANDFQSFVAAGCLHETTTPAAETDDGSLDHRETPGEVARCRIASTTAALSLSGPSIAMAARSRSACASGTGRRRLRRAGSASVSSRYRDGS